MSDVKSVVSAGSEGVTVGVGQGEAGIAARVRSPRADAWRRFSSHRLSVISLFFLLLVVVVAVFAPQITGASPTAMTSLPLLPPSSAHLMGTDALGRDLWARVAYGARISLLVGLGSQAIAVTIGMAIGALAGFYRGVLGQVLMRFTDMMLSLPALLFALLFLALFGSSVRVVILALGLSMWPPIARLERGQVLQTMNLDHVEAAYMIGCSNRRVLQRHVIPFTLGPVAVQATFGIAQAILYEAFLAFVGLGAQPPTPSWGRLLTEGYEYVRTSPHLIVFPTLALALTLIAINFVGDGLRDALDPQRP